MTERSYYWDGTTTGDATLAPYSSDIYIKLWKILFSGEDNEGIIDDYLNALVVSGATGGVSVATGAALIAGTFYTNSIPVSVTITSPVTDPRIDRIVLQKIWSAKTIRIARVAGTENASPTAPSLTQTDGSIWEIPLAQALITTAGVITVTNEREVARTPLAVVESVVLIETITSDGLLSGIDFQNIPQTYKHLFIIGQILNTAVEDITNIELNGDGVAINYNRMAFIGTTGIAVSQGFAALLPRIGTRAFNVLTNARGTQFELKIPNYTNTIFYKNIIQDEITIENNTPNDWGIGFEGAIWLDTSAISRITLQPQFGGVLKIGSQATLYAIR